MNSNVTTADVLDAISTVIKHLPLENQGLVWQRISETAQAYREQKLTMDDFVLSLLPNSLFTQEELKLLRAVKALPEMASA
jgi:hypothetical protein